MTISGTKEWASSNENILSGCQHDRRYCYAKAMSVRHKKILITDWHNPVLRLDKINKSVGKRSGTIMFPTTHDIHPDDLDDSVNFLRKLLEANNKVLIVSKPHLTCIMRICSEFQEYKSQILFRFTIGSSNNDVLRFWEPNAPDFQERLNALRYAYIGGFKTSVSCEPMLDGNIKDVIRLTYQYVSDSIWIGKMNNISRCNINNTSNIDISEEIDKILIFQENDDNIIDLYNDFKDYSKIKWKESIKKIVGIKLAQFKGMDI